MNVLRILHSSDWHIGRQLSGYSLLEDQEYFLDWLVDVLKFEKIDLLLIAGDIYNSAAPSALAVGLLDEFLTKVVLELKIKVLIVAGNHDSAEKLSFSSKLLERQGLIIAGGLKDVRSLKFEQVGIGLLPYFNLAMVKEKFKLEKLSNFEEACSIVAGNIFGRDDCKFNILVAHGLYLNFGADCLSYCDSEIAVGGSDSVNLEKFKNFDYFALGHLHGPQKAGGRGVYSGSPLKYSVSEAGHRKRVVLIETGTDCLKTSSIYVSPLRDLKVLKGRFCDLLKIKSDDYVSVQLTDDEFIIDPYSRLKVGLPNILDLSYLNLKIDEISNAKVILDKSVEDLFSEFYSNVVGKEISENELKFFKKVVEEVDEPEII